MLFEAFELIPVELRGPVLVLPLVWFWWRLCRFSGVGSVEPDIGLEGIGGGPDVLDQDDAKCVDEGCDAGGDGIFEFDFFDIF